MIKECFGHSYLERSHIVGANLMLHAYACMHA